MTQEINPGPATAAAQPPRRRWGMAGLILLALVAGLSGGLPRAFGHEYGWFHHGTWGRGSP